MFRLATPDDIPQIAQLEEELFPETSLGEGTLHREFEHDLCWVLGKPVQAYALVRLGVIHDLLRIGVSKERQEQGIGSLLLSHVLESHPGEWMLTVWNNNPRARKLYQSFGFHLHGFLPEAWVMRRRERKSKAR